MFWRRKKKEDSSEDSRSSFVALNPDQVADALLGHESQDSTPQDLTSENHAPEATPLLAQPATPAQAATQDEEFYFEADADENPPAHTPSTAQSGAAVSQQTVDAEAPPEPAVLTPHAAVTELLSFLNAAPAAPESAAPIQEASVAQPATNQPVAAQPATVQSVAAQPVALQSPPSSPVASPAALPESNLDWNLEALRGVPLEVQGIVRAMSEQWQAGGLSVEDTDALRLARNAVVRVPLVLKNAQQEFWVFVYPVADARASAHFVAVERKANIFGAVAVYLAPTALALSGVEPAQLEWPVSASLSVWPADKPFPEGDYALWWPSQAGEHLANTEEGRLLTRIFTLQDEAASLLYGVLSRQLGWNSEEGMPLRRELPERTQYLHVMDSEGRPMILSAAQEKGVRLHLPRSSESEERRGQWLMLTEQYLKLMVKLLLSAGQPLDTLWHDYETRPSQWWKAAQQVLDLRLDIGDNLAEIHVGNVAEEQAQAAEA